MSSINQTNTKAHGSWIHKQLISKAGDKSLLIEMEIKVWELPNLQPNYRESLSVQNTVLRC